MDSYENALRKLAYTQLEFAAGGTEENEKSALSKAEADFLQACRNLSENGSLLYLEYLMECFSLSSLERHCVRLIYAFEIEQSLAFMAEELQSGCQMVTPYLLGMTSGEEESSIYEMLVSDGFLRRFFLKEGFGMDTQPFCMRRLLLDERIIEFSMGDIGIGKPYRQVCQLMDIQTLEPWIGEWNSQIEWWLEHTSQSKMGNFLYLYGEKGCGKHFWICHVSLKYEFACCNISLKRCAELLADFRAERRYRWMDGFLRELLISGMVPVFTCGEEDISDLKHIFEAAADFIDALAEYVPHIFICAEHKLPLTRPASVTYLKIPPMTMLEGKHFWEEKGRNYPIDPEFDLGSMANRFQLTPGRITRILKNAEISRRQKEQLYLTLPLITAECYDEVEQQMGKKTIHVPANYQMKDLILPKRQKSQLQQICDQIRFKHKIYEEWGFQEQVAYGRGISVVFAGSPGTGKTMAAQALAGELGMELYKVDLSCIVSKYVGETEKNLDEIFEQASKSQVILFFDEADVLFGKRTETKDSNDKYSNMEAAFLLQKMEAYEGIAILATNLFHHFDEAFKRRLKVVIEFPMPSEEDRRLLWQNMIPEKMPTGEIDFDYLAHQFELSGSNIRNILLHAAFLAAANGKAMDMEEIIPAIKNEYTKNGKNLVKSDMSEYYIYLK